MTQSSGSLSEKKTRYADLIAVRRRNDRERTIRYAFAPFIALLPNIETLVAFS
jgi:hypothetical protein